MSDEERGKGFPSPSTMVMTGVVLIVFSVIGAAKGSLGTLALVPFGVGMLVWARLRARSD